MTSSARIPRRRVIAGLGLAAVALASGAVPAAPAAAAPPGTGAGTALDHRALRQSLDAVHAAGMYGVYAQARDGHDRWQGASGVADVATRRPVRPDMRHRVGSITKTFTAVAILQQVAKGRIDLDAPIGRYLPHLVPGERGRRITVRMLLNHSSGIADYIPYAFPSLLQGSAQSLDDNRFRTFRPEELARLGLNAPPTHEPGQDAQYSNTNYVIAGLLLEKVTRTRAEDYITRHVIHKAGLRDTYFPHSPVITGPHAKAYEAMYGLIDPPRDYSVYDMSWAGTAGALVSTVDDLNTFFRLLLTGRILRPAELAEMKKTVPLTDGQGNVLMHYGLGIYYEDWPCGRFWGHSGGVFGMGTYALTGEDGGRQLSLGFNLMKYNTVDENGRLVPHPIDYALIDHMYQGLCGSVQTMARAARPRPPIMIDDLTVKRR